MGTHAASTARLLPTASPPTTAAEASPTSSVSSSEPLALVTSGFVAGGTGTYEVALVATDGHVVAQATAHLPSTVPVTLSGCPQFQPGASPTCTVGFRPWAPLAMASNSRAYYLDGDTDIRFLAPDGTTGLAAHLPPESRTRYVFAVDPGNTRLAVSAFSYAMSGSYPMPGFTLRIFIQNLATGANHIDLFTSSSVAEWPIGWHSGKLVIGVGSNQPPQTTAANPYWAFVEYHVVDAATGRRLATIGSIHLCNYGPLVHSGTACLNPLGFQSWDGSFTEFSAQPPSGPGYDGPVLSPDGSRLAAVYLANPPDFQIYMLSASGVMPTHVVGGPEGWIDSAHLVYETKDSLLHVLALDSLSVQSVGLDAGFSFVGTVPQQMD